MHIDTLEEVAPMIDRIRRLDQQFRDLGWVFESDLDGQSSVMTSDGIDWPENLGDLETLYVYRRDENVESTYYFISSYLHTRITPIQTHERP